MKSLSLNKFYCFLKPKEINKCSLENFNIHKKATPSPSLNFFINYFMPSPTHLNIEIWRRTGQQKWLHTIRGQIYHARKGLGRGRGDLKGSITCKSPSMNPSRKQFQFCAEVHSGEQLNEHPPTHFFCFFFLFYGRFHNQ